jgi:AcrB/AcrD/AcrF family
MSRLCPIKRLLRQLGDDAYRAAWQAAMTRLHPVLVTATVASLGFLPMAVSTNSVSMDGKRVLVAEQKNTLKLYDLSASRIPVENSKSRMSSGRPWASSRSRIA